MKKKNVFVALVTLAMLGNFTACSDEDDPVNPPVNPTEYSFDNLPADTDVKPTEEEMDAVVIRFVDAVAIPTYAELEEKMAALKTAVDKFESCLSQNDLDDACQAWRDARRPWEQSEAFLYGPADLKKLDPSLDSWPLDKNGIEDIIASGDWDAIDGEVNENEEAVDAPQNLRGFHTAEKLLFNDGDPRNVKTFQANELIYLQKVVNRMLTDVQTLHKAWTHGLGNSDTEVPTAYGTAMKAHDGKNYSLSSVYAAIETMLNGDNGMAGISNEVGTSKIQDPVDKWNSGDKEAGVLAVESWYSWNSLDDYYDNIISIKNCYFGGRNENYDAEKSLSALVKKINPTLDSLITVQINTTMEAINDIPHPFRNNLDKATEITRATDACATLTKGLGIVRAKLSDSSN